METALGGYRGGLNTITTTGSNIVELNDGSGVLVGNMEWNPYPFYPYTPSPWPHAVSGEQCPCCNEKWKRRKGDKSAKSKRRNTDK